MVVATWSFLDAGVNAAPFFEGRANEAYEE